MGIEVQSKPQTNTTNKKLSDIELFAIAYFDIRLTSHQLKLIDDTIHGRQIRISRRMGQRTADKVLRAYVAEGCKPNGRLRLPQHHLPVRTKLKASSQAGRILELIKRPDGAYNFELSRVALCYSKRIQELREDGHNIPAPERQYLKNGRASNTYRYYIIGD